MCTTLSGLYVFDVIVTYEPNVNLLFCARIQCLFVSQMYKRMKLGYPTYQASQRDKVLHSSPENHPQTAITLWRPSCIPKQP